MLNKIKAILANWLNSKNSPIRLHYKIFYYDTIDQIGIAFSGKSGIDSIVDEILNSVYLCLDDVIVLRKAIMERKSTQLKFTSMDEEEYIIDLRFVFWAVP